MKILLDIDGVLVTTPIWKPVELHSDGFLKFNEKASQNLAKLIDETKASIILTSTHRINYSISEWYKLLETRGIKPTSISKINEISTIAEMENRATEIKNWVEINHGKEPFVVIDDDLSINGLPENIKNKCVLTKPMIGLNEEVMKKALEILFEK
jgi:16S rRNA C1402 (ribose-2'-O) methylase RsmI